MLLWRPCREMSEKESLWHVGFRSEEKIVSARRHGGLEMLRGRCTVGLTASCELRRMSLETLMRRSFRCTSGFTAVETVLFSKKV